MIRRDVRPYFGKFPGHKTTSSTSVLDQQALSIKSVYTEGEKDWTDPFKFKNIHIKTALISGKIPTLVAPVHYTWERGVIHLFVGRCAVNMWSVPFHRWK